jgi:hypothetical protein
MRVAGKYERHSPFSCLFTAGEDEAKIIHIKSQRNNLTRRGILFFAVILHVD